MCMCVHLINGRFGLFSVLGIWFYYVFYCLYSQSFVAIKIMQTTEKVRGAAKIINGNNYKSVFERDRMKSTYKQIIRDVDDDDNDIRNRHHWQRCIDGQCSRIDLDDVDTGTRHRSAHTSNKRLKCYAQTLCTYWPIIINDKDDDDGGGAGDNDVASTTKVRITQSISHTSEFTIDWHMHQRDQNDWTLMHLMRMHASNRNGRLFANEN